MSTDLRNWRVVPGIWKHLPKGQFIVIETLTSGIWMWYAIHLYYVLTFDVMALEKMQFKVLKKSYTAGQIWSEFF